MIFATKPLKEYPGYACIQIGHSLGGFHAHICGYILKHRVIAIDPPSSKEIITQLSRELDTAQCEKHYSFFMMKNLINKTNNHVGKLAYYNRQLQETGMLSSCEESIRTLETHSLDFFMAHIPKNSPDPIINLPDRFSWQKSSVRRDSTESSTFQCLIS